jgi:hypothetical protein
MNGNRGELTAEKLKAALISTTEDQLQNMVDFVCEQVKKSKEYPFFSISTNLQFSRICNERPFNKPIGQQSSS